MNKTELVSAVAEKSGLSKVDAKKALDATLEVIAGEVKKGEKVVLIGFGTFSVSERSARQGINPRTKEAIKIPAKKAAKFKAGAELSNL
jgi:DNA-binding protein HU-beta